MVNNLKKKKKFIYIYINIYMCVYTSDLLPIHQNFEEEKTHTWTPVHATNIRSRKQLRINI